MKAETQIAGGGVAGGAVPGSRRRNKFNAVPTVVDGIRFASKAEARRYGELKLLYLGGYIRALRVHPRFPLEVNGEPCGSYEGDFEYLEERGEPWVRVVEDVKSKATRTPLYRLKAKLMRALYGVEVREVTA